jgi:hypothetical protein
MAGRAMPKLRLLLTMAGFGSTAGFSPTSLHFTDTTYLSAIRGMRQARPASTIIAFDDDAGTEYLYFADATQACTE